MKSALLSLILSATLLAGCSGGIIPNAGPSSAGDRVSTAHADKAAVPIPATPDSPLTAPVANGDGKTALSLGLVRGPDIQMLALEANKTQAAFAAFKTSCPSVSRKEDLSGLTLPTEWKAVCDAAKSWSGPAQNFFANYLEAIQVGDGKAFATGYYEPEILASRTKQKGYEAAIYKRPTDLVEADLGDFAPDLKGRKIRGRIKGRALVLYDDRTAIENGSLAGKGLEIAYAADPVEFFFLQVQGSGRLRFPDGSVARINYDSQNGHPYTGIGKWMKERKMIPSGDYSMQGLGKWLRENPTEARNVMRQNKSFVFFTEQADGPKGAMGYNVIAESSVAADPKYIPLGAPVWLSMDRAEPNGLWVAQDTGGAIKGANRVDTFWGAGDRAVGIAGGMSAHGSALLFIPKESARRLGL